MIPIEKDYEIQVSRRKYKKYDIYHKGKYLLSFGDNRYEQFEDKTPLQYYKNLNHLDEDRRNRYYSRHGFSNDKSSAKYWSNKYLW